LAYAVGSPTPIVDDTTAAEGQLLREGRDKPALVRYGREKGLEPAQVAEALQHAEIEFNVGNWDEMIIAVDNYVIEMVD